MGVRGGTRNVQRAPIYMRDFYLHQSVMMFSGYFICVQISIFIYRGDQGLKLLLEHLGFRFQIDKMKLFQTTDIFVQAIYVCQNLSSRRITICIPRA